MTPHYKKKLEGQRKTTVHYFAVVKLDGRWTPCDASFSRVVLHVFAQLTTAMGYGDRTDCFYRPFGPDSPVNYVACFSGQDPYAGLAPLSSDHINNVMLKNPFFDIDNYGALNIKLDKLQGIVFDQPR
jgi:hypothetical protein